MEIGVDQASLVHALQNHDELTYELMHFAARHKDEVFELNGRNSPEPTRRTSSTDSAGASDRDNAPYNACSRRTALPARR